MHERELRAVSFLLQRIRQNDLLKIGMERLLCIEGYPNLETLCSAFGKAVETVIYHDLPEVDIPIIQDLRIRVDKKYNA